MFPEEEGVRRCGACASCSITAAARARPDGCNSGDPVQFRTPLFQWSLCSTSGMAGPRVCVDVKQPALVLSDSMIILFCKSKAESQQSLVCTPSVPNYKSFQEFWRVNIFQI